MTQPPLTFIGVIHTPFTDPANMPIQPPGARDVLGTVVIDPEYAEGLKDLDGFSHIYLLYYFHKAAAARLRVVPFMDSEERGVFATRSPLRPGRIGLSLVELVAVEGTRLTVRGIDVLDGTPLIDIKPYIPQFDCWRTATSGWMKGSLSDVEKKHSDNRFV